VEEGRGIKFKRVLFGQRVIVVGGGGVWWCVELKMCGVGVRER
jgi:hypothetical protein